MLANEKTKKESSQCVAAMKGLFFFCVDCLFLLCAVALLCCVVVAVALCAFSSAGFEKAYISYLIFLRMKIRPPGSAANKSCVKSSVSSVSHHA